MITALAGFVGLVGAADPSAQADTMPVDPRQEGVRLNEAGLMAVFSGITHNGAYEFDREGLPTKRFVETTFKDGRVLHIQGARVDRGKWSVSDDNICYVYLDDPGFGSCFHIYKLGTCYFHHPLNDGGSDSAYWTARSVIKGERPDCVPQVS